MSNTVLNVKKRVEDSVLHILKQKENELDEIISDYSAIENRVLKTRDDDETIESLRASRLRQLKELHNRRQEYLNKGFGRIIEVHSDKEFFDACKNAESIVVHFYRPTTKRCEYLDGQIMKIVETHFDTRFIKVNVEKTPFICERFNIWCIPTLMIIKDGKTDHSIIGFDEFGGDGFSCETFIKVLSKYNIKPYKPSS